MNASSDRERVLPDGGTRSAAVTQNGNGTRRPILLTWQGPATTRLESARLVLGDSKLRAIGRVIAGPSEDGPAHFASYELAADDTGAVTRLSLFVTTAEDERQVTISRSGEGIWLVEHKGEEAQRVEFGGALDIDVSNCVLFNALPVRRLGLHRNPGTAELPMVFVRLPELRVELVTQTYRTLSTSENGARIEYVQGDFRVEIDVDRDGMVLDYPGYATRV